MFSPSPLNDDQPERCWRHLDTCQYQTILHASPPRTQCAQHGVMVVKLPWAEAGARFTALFEALAIDWMKAANQQAVADLLDLSWDEIHGIQERAVKRGLERRKREPIVHLGVDEKAFRKGHNYLTLVNDLGGSRVLYVPEDRQQGSLDGFWRTLTEEQTQGIQAVAMDMWDPYIDSVRDHLPEADKKIVFDKFHIAKLSLLKTRSRQKRHEAQEPWRSWDLARGSRSNHGPPIDLVRSDDARRCRPFRPENAILRRERQPTEKERPKISGLAEVNFGETMCALVRVVADLPPLSSPSADGRLGEPM